MGPLAPRTARACALILGVALGGGLVAARAAHADRSRAKDFFMAGSRHFESDRFDDAIRDFGYAYQEAPEPDILFNIAQAHRMAGHREEAIRYYQRYLKEASPSSENHAAVTALVRQLQREARAAAAAQLLRPPPAPQPPRRRWPLVLGISLGVVAVAAAVTTATVLTTRPQDTLLDPVVIP